MSSAEPDADGPECWSTAIVLRAAKAMKRAIEAGAARAVQEVLAPNAVASEPRAWDELIINTRVRERLEAPRVRSAVLAGPPGTGKTTLMKSLATRTGAKDELVTIAPDYLTAGGVAHLTGRLKHVFLLLSLLKRGVIFFDEIDELLLECGRSPRSA
jgi:replication-associated recombination protein RarA